MTSLFLSPLESLSPSDLKAYLNACFLTHVDDRVQHFIRQLAQFDLTGLNVFNPWLEAPIDLMIDTTVSASLIRRLHLGLYLTQRLKTAQYLLIAEAPGYQGAKFSGIAMTCERMLLGYHAKVKPCHIINPIQHQGIIYTPQRTSQIQLSRSGFKGMNEPTATIVWSHLLQSGFDSHAFVLWNTFAFHPHLVGKLFSNRTPTHSEVIQAIPLLLAYLNLFPNLKIIALGNIAHKTLNTLNIKAFNVRHPSMGGATLFKEQMIALS